jgi:DNA-binding response OmpR family regulator
MNCQDNSLNRYNKYILIVDDGLDNTSLLNAVLTSQGYQVDVANDGYTAIFKIKNNPPTLVLLDAMMPEINGFQVAQWIQKNYSYINILLVTACDESSVLSELDNYQVLVDGVIYKPFNIIELLNKIETILTPNTPKQMSSLL